MFHEVPQNMNFMNHMYHIPPNNKTQILWNGFAHLWQVSSSNITTFYQYGNEVPKKWTLISIQFT